MTRRSARAARGQRAHGKVPFGQWRRLTILGALTLEGVVASMSRAAATSTAVFLAFVEQALVPALRRRPEAMVVMDNLPAHKAELVQDKAGLGHRYLPPYSPDVNPIEQAWSKLNTRLRAEGARSIEALEQALGPALASITAQDAKGWFRRCGYGPANSAANRSKRDYHSLCTDGDTGQRRCGRRGAAAGARSGARPDVIVSAV
jgi:transposase